MRNQKVAELLYKIADLLELQGVNWKPQAYRKAARSIESLSDDVYDFYKQGRLLDIPGVGEGIAKKIEDYLKNGKSQYYDKLKKKTPIDVESLMSIPGMGPKKIQLIHKKLKVRNLTDLEKAAKEHKLQRLSGMGKKSENDIIEGIERFKQSKGRMLLDQAADIGNQLLALLRKNDDVEQAEIVGSYRRCKETVGDLDILVVAKKTNKTIEEITKYFSSLPAVRKIVSTGPRRTSVILKEGINADLRIFDKNQFGAAMLYFTGSKEHNILLRRIAIEKGMKLNEYGLFKNEKLVASKTETDIYKTLGLQYVPPELREAQGEIDAAEKNQLPNLIERKDIKGDLQMHTKYSDGISTIEEMAIAAAKLGHDYIAVTDHSGRLKIANAMTNAEIKKQWNEIDSLNKELKTITIMKGVEVNITPDGELDIDTKLLPGFDIVLLAVHSSFKMPANEQTERIIKAIESGYGNVLSHPTTRIIGQRQEISFDMSAVMRACKENNVAMELDCYPNRMDLKDVYLKMAADMGCKISVGTDAHSAKGLQAIDAGVGTLRRGWLEPEDVINTMTISKLNKWLKK